jgi:hypothetical protein
MQELKPETVGQMIALVRELNSGAETMMPDDEEDAYEHGKVDVDEDALESERHDEHEHDPTYLSLQRFVNELGVDEQCELIALAWLGRGDGTRDDWNDLYELARERHSNHTPDYLLAMPMLAEFLADGMEAFGYSAEDYE